MKSKISLLALAFLTACGGGGGSSSPTTPSIPSTPAPTIQVTLSAPKIFIGDTVKISWTSINATTCTGVEGFAGIQPISGTINFTPTAGGQYKYSLRCTGAGGSSESIQTVMVPIPPQRTSYLNFKNSGMGQIKAPEYTQAMAYGDFFQDGSISLVSSPIIADMKNPADINKVGKIKFYKNTNGTWVDKTADILADNTGCVWPRKAVSADFNGDKKPDIFLSCHGFDAAPFAGEKQVLLLSQPDGKYKRTNLDFVCYCHSATAADFTGEGYADLVITDTSGDFKQPIYLSNNRNGTFSIDRNKLSTSVNAEPVVGGAANVRYGKGIYTAEFVDFNNDGHPDLYLAGHDVDSTGKTEVDNNLAWSPKIFININNTFTGSPILLPIDKSLFANLDVYLDGDIVWMLKTDYTGNSFKLAKFDLKTNTELPPVYIPLSGTFLLIKDPVKGMVPAIL